MRAARRVVVSLWNVNDKATRNEARFYRECSEKIRPLAALRTRNWKCRSRASGGLLITGPICPPGE